MGFEFRPAVRQDVNLLLGVAGASGSGKTYSAMRLAKGISGDEPFAVIDTENGRARHYAGAFKFDSADLTAPFTPARYIEAIQAADKAGYRTIIIDSMSHSWAGDGGCLDMQQAEFERMGSRETTKLLSWAKPKQEHKHMVSKLLQVRAHVILCFRAEPKVEIAKDDKGKTVIVPKQSLTGLDGWVPICEKNLPFELTLSALLVPDRPGVPQWIKFQEQFKPFFQPGKPLDENAGARILEWAKGTPNNSAAGAASTGESQPDTKPLESPSPEGDSANTPGTPKERIIVSDYETMLKDANEETLGPLWIDIYKVCRDKNDPSALARLTIVKDERKRELGL